MKQRLKIYWDKLEPNLPYIIIAWSIGFYTLSQSVKHINLDQPDDIHIIHLIFLGIAFFFILMPFFKTIKIGKYLELERNLKETKDDIKEFKSEIRQSVQILSSTLTASIGNLNNQVTINLPSTEELKKEIEKLKQQSTLGDTIKLTEIKDELLLDEDEDIVMALARTRIKIEVLLRIALDARRSIANTEDADIKFLGLNSLFDIYVDNNPKFLKFKNSFGYVQQICNAAVHGHIVSKRIADEALQLGAIIIQELSGQANG